MPRRRTVRAEERVAASAARERRTRVRATSPQAALYAQTQRDVCLSRQWRLQAGEGARDGSRQRVHARPVRYHGDEAAAGFEPSHVAGDSQSDYRHDGRSWRAAHDAV